MKNNKNTYIALGVIVLIIVGLVAYLFIRSNNKVEDLGTPGKPKVTDLSTASSTFPALALSVNPGAADNYLYKVLGNLEYGVKTKTKLINGFYLGRFEDCGGASCLGVTYYSHMKLEQHIIEGDLNGDGTKDAVVVVSSGTTKSPDISNVPYTTHAVGAVINEGGAYKNVAAINLTDDVGAKTSSVKDIKISKGVISVTVLKNVGLNNPEFPEGSETVQLTLDSSATSTSGFKVVRTRK